MEKQPGSESWRYAWYVAGLTLTGAALRLSTIDTRGFWLDETTTVRQASLSVPGIIAREADNVHPPFFHILMHFWMEVFGRSEVAVRLFAATWGIVAIPLAYWAARELYDRRTGLIAAGILALSQFYIWYAQEARMYTMMLVFSLVSTVALWKGMQSNRFGWWAAYALSTTTGIMTQYFFAFLVAVQVVYFALFLIPSRLRERAASGELRSRWSRPWRVVRDVPQIGGFAASMAVAAVPFLWWLPKVLSNPELFQAVSGPANYGWVPPRLGVHFNEIMLVTVEAVLGFHSHLVMKDLVSAWPLLITLGVLSISYATRVSRVTGYLMVTGLGTATVLALLGQWQPIIVSRYFTAALTPITLLAARFLSRLRPAAFKPVVAVLLVASLVGWADQSFNPRNELKWDNREAMAVVRDNWQYGDVILLIPFFVSSIPEYYLTPAEYASVVQVPAFGADGRLRNSPAQLDQDLDREVGNADRVWIIATWQDTPRIVLDRKNTVKWLRSQGFEPAREDEFYRINVYLYERPERGSSGAEVGP